MSSYNLVFVYVFYRNISSASPMGKLATYKNALNVFGGHWKQMLINAPANINPSPLLQHTSAMVRKMFADNRLFLFMTIAYGIHAYSLLVKLSLKLSLIIHTE